MLTITYYEIVTLHSIPELYLVFHQDWVLDTYTEEKIKKELEARKEFFLARETSNHSPAPLYARLLCEPTRSSSQNNSDIPNKNVNSSKQSHSKIWVLTALLQTPKKTTSFSLRFQPDSSTTVTMSYVHQPYFTLIFLFALRASVQERAIKEMKKKKNP